MKIFYDNVSSDYSYPLSKKDVKQIKKFIDFEIWNKIRGIKFGCNTKTTQEGRTVKRGRFYDIRINFCLNNMRSLILSKEKKYISEISLFGGQLDFKNNIITWRILDAKFYALYILLHEIGHIIYCEKYLNDEMNGKAMLSEEQWCDNYAMKILEAIKEKYLEL